MYRNVYIDSYQCIDILGMLNQLTNLDLRLIRVFLAVVRAGGVSAAQNVLNISQSTISTQIATLETRLGFTLCQRGRSGFKLTEKGRLFLEMSDQLIRNIELFEHKSRHINRKLVGELHIGLIGHLPINHTLPISEAISLFRQRDEAVRFHIAVHSPRSLEEALTSGRIQIAIGYFWHKLTSLEYTPLFCERQLAYCGKHHPLFKKAGQLMADDLLEHEWAWRSYTLPEANNIVRPARISATADNMEATALLILSGHLGYLPQHFAAPYVQQGLMAALNPTTLTYNVTFHVAAIKKAQQDEITKAFLKDLKTAYLSSTSNN